MPISTKQTLISPGPTAGVTLLGSNLTLTNYNDVTSAAVPADHQVALLSVVASYKEGSQPGASAITLADEDENIVLCVSAGGYSNNNYGFLYPPLFPAGKKLLIKCKSDDAQEANLILYVQYMLVPV